MSLFHFVTSTGYELTVKGKQQQQQQREYNKWQLINFILFFIFWALHSGAN